MSTQNRSGEAGWPKAVLFDLDGTLVDSAPDIHAALNEMMAEEGEAEFTIGAVKRMIGGGVPKLIDRAWAAHGKTLDAQTRKRLIARYIALYAPRATRLTVLYPGAADLLARLKNEGRILGVVTNKPGAETTTILRHFALDGLLDTLVGGDAGPAVKPEPGLLLLAAERLGLAPDDILFVGDSENDVGAARAAGMAVAALRGGYTVHAAEDLGADAVLESLSDLPGRFAALQPRTPF